ncbi:hypothetical protein LOTGIDRAFT_129609 [Lottia gigantea]|uniref:J domain-containing protein n=1 Tax=Lottia gigantea TaxID=225164 RepID=V3Z5X4_LOTGI|nr:hypothetical protein LOTGIDRAFT_129609 [Lottia gigantea]ESO86178.1 hypothetical protein LOTGIDRAFT_129609 [Lottia gigantea]
MCWFACVFTVNAYIDGLYCGRENCYDILESTRDMTKNEIIKNYRKLARQWHPDRHKTEEGKKEAHEKFQKIGNAYEILKDDEQRVDYNYMLDNPDEYYSHYFYYYQHRLAPKVDIRIVIAVTISIVSVFQYFGAWSNYNAAIDYLCKDPKYRSRAIDTAMKENKLSNPSMKGKSRRVKIKEDEEQIIREVIESNMDIRGGYQRPKYTDVLWIQIIFLPYYLLMYIVWWFQWTWKFTIKREEYGEEEKLYLIRKYMKCGTTQWEAIDEDDKLDYLDQELWKKDNFKVWKQQQDEEMKAKLAESARYKSYRRYMKKGGPGQISFGPD